MWYRGFVFDHLNFNTGWRVLIVGGRYTNGLTAGLFQFNANNASSNANANVGARLLVSPFGADSSTPLGENIAA